MFYSNFSLFPVFSTSSRHPAAVQPNRGPDKGKRESQFASACLLQPHSWQEAACNSAASCLHTSCCTQARDTGLTSHPPEIPLLVVNSLGLGHWDTSVLSGLGSIQMELLSGGNAAGTWAPPEKQSPSRIPFPTYCFSPNFPNTAMLILWQSLFQQDGQAALKQNLIRNLIPA